VNLINADKIIEGILHTEVVANGLDPATLTTDPASELLAPIGFTFDAEIREPVGRDGDDNREGLIPDRASFDASFSSLR
jgi:hypothetical protein